MLDPLLIILSVYLALNLYSLWYVMKGLPMYSYPKKKFNRIKRRFKKKVRKLGRIGTWVLPLIIFCYLVFWPLVPFWS